MNRTLKVASSLAVLAFATASFGQTPSR
ncbi:hypothetical protein OR37_02647, partial [Caulobacter vibrioides OR37]